MGNPVHTADRAHVLVSHELCQVVFIHDSNLPAGTFRLKKTPLPIWGITVRSEVREVEGKKVFFVSIFSRRHPAPEPKATWPTVLYSPEFKVAGHDDVSRRVVIAFGSTGPKAFTCAVN